MMIKAVKAYNSPKTSARKLHLLLLVRVDLRNNN